MEINTDFSNIIDLPSYCKESQRRGELVEVYLINRKTNDVIYTATNPNFIAGVVKAGYKSSYKLVTQ